jgi:hypothetical protein
MKSRVVGWRAHVVAACALGVVACSSSGDDDAMAGEGTGGTAAPLGGQGTGGTGTGGNTAAPAGGSGGMNVSGSGGAPHVGMKPMGSGGTSAMPSAKDGGATQPDGGADSGEMIPTGPGLPPVDDYSAPGPFGDAKMIPNVGPNGAYTLFRPDATLGKDGFKHPIATWGNGIDTTPDMYEKTLTLIATHGFVIIAGNDTMAEEPILTAGMEWLIEQNTADGELKGKLDTSTEVAIGYSWGGGAAIDTSYRPNIKCTVSLHGMPPRKTDAFDTMHAPLLLFTSTGDTFVTADQYVTPNYEKSKVQTFYATLDDPNAGHLYVADENPANIVCSGGAALGLGECKGDPAEHAPTIAWLRLWVYGDEGAKKFFYGDDCSLCSGDWTMPQRKNWP